MTHAAARGLALLLASWVFAGTGTAQEPALPDREEFFAAARENLARAQREQFRYAYKERRSELHVNPFGSRIGTGGTRVYDVTPGPAAGVYIRRLIERDGKPVTNSQPERQERRSQSPNARSTIQDVADMLDFRIDRREVIDARPTIVVDFTAKPDAKPSTREARIARNFKGTIWVDEAAREVSRAQGIATGDLSFGYGFLGRLDEGSTATFTRQPAGDIWLPSSVRFVGEGRAMFFRKLTLDYIIEWFDYKKVR
jgi:hypothetical protein